MTRFKELEEREPNKSYPLTRQKAERIGKACVTGEQLADSEDNEIAALFRQVVSGWAHSGSGKQIQNAWMELRRRLTSQQIRTVYERARDARLRMEKAV